MDIGDYADVIFDDGTNQICEIIGKRDKDGALLLYGGSGLTFTLGMREGFKLNGWRIDDDKLILGEPRYWIIEGCIVQS